MRKHPQIVIGVLLIALFICIAITAPLLAPNDPNATNLALKNAPPSAEYPLGCDQMGRCDFSRLILRSAIFTKPYGACADSTSSDCIVYWMLHFL